MRKTIIYQGKDYGTIGEVVPLSSTKTKICVGDYVLFATSSLSLDSHYAGVVVKEPRGIYSIFGFCGNDITNPKSGIDIKSIVVPFNLLTSEICAHRHSVHMIVEEVETIKMTLEDIEKELGYKIELV